ncbi:hypothetical protein [Parachryseolinea silvisoli]|uniref:hypothetical protein n=1 Tax=Parachryseolinea silvisoli TaxID=2873601 RepID=UPI002265DB5B|nr:hypothetical protein [Parachryseolinea silvisoli]MCD9019852.1 hypothetical protein [Parachryseolinea silvisoli]
MGKQTSIIKLEGKCGDKVYYWHPKYGWLIRNVTSVNAERILTDPAFALVREHNAQFARGAMFVKALRAAFYPLFQPLADTHMTSRITSAIAKAIKADPATSLKERRLAYGDLRYLIDLNFNNETSLKKILTADYSTTKALHTHTTTFTPQGRHFIKAPKSATHFRLVSSIATISYEATAVAVDTTYSDYIPTRQGDATPIILTNTCASLPESFMTHAVGVEFFQETNGGYYPLNARACNALAIIAAEKVIQPKRKNVYKRGAINVRKHCHAPRIPLFVRIARERSPVTVRRAARDHPNPGSPGIPETEYG